MAPEESILMVLNMINENITGIRADIQHLKDDIYPRVNKNERVINRHTIYFMCGAGLIGAFQWIAENYHKWVK